jgi:hemerythrin-like metal-binding protein
MPFLNWEPRYQVGVALIDEQHRQLFDQINVLYDAMQAGRGKGEIEKTVAFLVQYTVDHFKAEEDLMLRSGYPGYQEHKAIHEDLTRQVLELQARLEKGSQMLSLAVMHFLRDWLSHHIADVDRKMNPHLNQSGIH